MCGIAGILLGPNAPSSPGAVAESMAASLWHRGPDDGGVWQDAAAGVALSHRRLAVIDTTTGGRQPMVSASGRFVLTYNGEIYNYRELRQRLLGLGCGIHGSSDTAVLLAAIEEWGVSATVGHLVGMFAFAVWDRQLRRLSLVRDRVGEKPLYYGLTGSCFAFASELRAMLRVPGFRPSVARHAVELYLRHGYVPAPVSILESVLKVPPGHIAEVNIDEHGDFGVSISPYWQLADFVNRRETMSYEDARERADGLLTQAVRGQLMSDVPLGAFLSGGVDSTAIVALMQEQGGGTVKTFSLGSTEAAYDESRHAADVARHLGTDHTEFIVDASEAMAVVPELGSIYDEPFADSSQIPTVLVSRLARRNVTVALSGDGGDEVFGGYNRYVLAPRIARAMRYCPTWLARALAQSVAVVPAARWDRWSALFARARGVEPVRIFGERLHKLARAADSGSPRELYERLAACWTEPPVLVHATAGDWHWFDDPPSLASPERFVDLMMYLDFVTYLCDDILVKVDRASMSASLEARVPILDHRLVEFMATLPSDYKVSGAVAKRILREIAYARVPRSLIERRKTGFGVPIDVWLRGPLREWAESLLVRGRVEADGILDWNKVHAAWLDYLSGRKPRHHEIWAILMFQAWRESLGVT